MPFEPESILKGRIGESLVAQILREAGNQVYQFGYESTLQNLTQLEKVFERHSDTGEKIRSIPDFLVINKKGYPFFVEVKFRSLPDWHKDDPKMLERLKGFWKPIIIHINCTKKPYFLITKPPYCDKNKKLKGWPLEKADYLGISKKIIEKYEILVEKYLTPNAAK